MQQRQTGVSRASKRRAALLALAAGGATAIALLLGAGSGGGRVVLTSAPRHARHITLASAHRHAPIAGTVLFNGSRKSAWIDESATPTRVQEVPDPNGSGDTVLRFTTYASDVYPLTATQNPRSQLVTPSNILRTGHTYWESYEVYVPAPLPRVTSWLAFGAAVYGPPYNGTPAIELTAAAVGSGEDLRWQRNGFASPPWAIVWQQPILAAHWVRITWNFRLADAGGYAQLYVNGRSVTGANRYAMAVIDQADSQGPWFADLQNYWQAGEFSQLTVYFRDFKIATTRAAARS